MNKIYFPLVIFVTLISACFRGSPSLDGVWKLVSYGDASNPIPALPIVTSMSFGEDGSFGARFGCNTIGGTYIITDNKMTFGNISATEMFCEGVADQETTILNILTYKTLYVEMNDDQLTLTSNDGTSVIVLERE